MKITYWNHSGFSISATGADFLIDYIGGGYERGAKKVVALISHSHGDHRSKEAIDIADIIVDNMAEGDSRNVAGAVIRAFGSTDEGVSFLIDIDLKRVFHAGDLNYWHWKDESTAAEIAAARAAYERVLQTLAPYKGAIDAALFPVDPRLGADCGEGADMFIQALAPRMLIPMHFWRGAQTALDYAKARGGVVALTRAGESIDI